MDKLLKNTPMHQLTHGITNLLRRNKKPPKKFTLDEAKAKLDEILQFLDMNDADFYNTNHEDIIDGLITILNIPRFLSGLGEDEPIPMNSFAQFMTNLQVTGTYLEKTKYAQICVRMTIQYHDYLKSNYEPKSRAYANKINCLNMLIDSFRNYTDQSEILARDFGKFGGVDAVLNLLNFICSSEDKDEKSLEVIIKSLVQRSLAILHNCIRVCPDNRGIYRTANAVQTLSNLKDSYSSEDSMCSKVFLLLILSYIVDEKESESLAKSEDCIRLLTGLLDKAVHKEGHYALIMDLSATNSTAFSAYELMDGLNHLAINDANKAEIEKQGALSSIITMLKPDFSEEERQVATKMLWMLSFLESFKKKKEVQESVATLRSLTASDNPTIREASTYAIWEIQDNQRILPRDPPPSYEESASTHAQQQPSGHVMISYQWDSQKRVLLIRDKLQRAGYRVWMDVDRMRGDILDAMASAVEEADVLLICMTERYKDSTSCRSEAKYASKKNKPIIPLLMEADYDPDGWLGILLGTKLYYKFYSEEHMESSMDKLIQEIGDRGKMASDQIDGPIGPIRPQISVTEEATSPSLKPGDDMSQSVQTPIEWSTEQVQSWLEEIGLPELCTALDFCDGNHLKEMYTQYQQSPDAFRNELKADLGLGFRGLLKFTTALGQLFKSS